MSKLRDDAVKIVKKLCDAGHQAYFAGGCVRDMVMGNEPTDYDITTNAKPEEVQKLFKKTVAVGAQFGVVLVIVDGKQFEVATFRTEGPYSDGRRPDSVAFATAKEDVKRRDFTINGLLYDPLKDEVLDYVDGKRDIEKKIIRTIGEPLERFEEDKLRMIRAVRFASQLDFKIDEKTFDGIKKLADKITVVSWERIGDELTKIVTGNNRGRALQLLADTTLLRYIMPEVEKMIGVPQPEAFHPEGDVFEHTKLTLDQLDKPSDILAFATLFHDIGKPLTFEVTDRIRFSNHDVVGTEITNNICRRLKFSNEKRKKIASIVANHMRFMHAMEMRESKLKKLLQRDTFLEELELHRADCLASHRNLDIYNFLKEKYEELGEEEIKPEPLINGNDLIELGLSPGPIFKEILTKVEEMQLENKLKSKKKALEWVKKNYKSHR